MNYSVDNRKMNSCEYSCKTKIKIIQVCDIWEMHVYLECLYLFTSTYTKQDQ